MLLGLGALIAVAGGFAWEAMSVRASLGRAEPLLSSAKSAAAAADLEAAERDLRAAHEHVQAAVRRARGPFTTLAGLVPVAGRTPRAIRGAAEGAGLAVRAGLRATEAIGAFPTDEDGKATFGFFQGRIPVESWRAAAGPVAAADVLAGRAAARVADTPRRWVLPPVRRALTRLERDLATLREATDHATALATVIPALAGGDAAKRYLVALQNPSELRGTGGLLGGVTVLEARQGAIELTGERPDNEFGQLEKAAMEMPEWFVTRYDRFDGRTLWSNVNLEPDFPTTAPLVAAYYREITGETVDGVIALDPYALSALLEVTGPVTGPHGVTFEAATVAKYVMNDVYSIYETDSLLRKAVMLEAASVIFDRIKRGASPAALAEALAKSARRKRIQVWMRDEAVQRAVASLGVDGSFRPPSKNATMIGVVTQNAGANKIDFYLRRAMELDVHLRDGGGARVIVKVALTNTAPTFGLPRDVIGPAPVPNRPGVYEVGENTTYLSLYLPVGATDVLWREEGRLQPAERNLAPHAVISSRYVEIPSKSTVTNRVAFDLPPGVWKPGRGPALWLPRQAVLEGDRWTVRVHAPPGRRIDGTKTFAWSGSLNRDFLLELDMRRTVWRRIKDLVWR